MRAGNRGEHDLGRRDREVGAVMFADTERVEAGLIGDHRLFDDVAQDLRLRQRLTVVREGHVTERVHAELKRICHAIASTASSPSSRIRSR